MGYSVDAELVPPMIVYAYKNSFARGIIVAVKNVNPSWGVGKLDTGWMTTLTFFNYIT